MNKSKSKKELLEKTHDLSKIKKVIGIVSGKGGVGKSSVTSMLAIAMRRAGYKVGILDADITGPSIPKAFGIKKKAQTKENVMYPIETKTGIKVMSINLLLDNENDPVIWRGPILSNVVKQFWKDVIWGELDYLFIDMPPGTGDVVLTAFQSIKIDGIVVVTSPQDLVSMIVNKSVNMAEMMDIKVLGLIENMSFFECSKCGEKHNIFGESHIEKIAKEHKLSVITRLPIDKNIAEKCDTGDIELLDGEWFEDIRAFLDEEDKENRNIEKIAIAVDSDKVSLHFGQCKQFNVYSLQDKQICKCEIIENPGHKPGFLPKFLAEKNISMVIAKDMGPAAKDLFKDYGIDVVLVVEDSIDDVIKKIF